MYLMDLSEVLAQLRKERDAIDSAIRRRERLLQDRVRGQGRPLIFPSNGHGDGTNHAPPRTGNGKG